MRSVTCSSCGKRYDYDVDEFCPKCGSYTPPVGRKAQPHAGRKAAVRPQAAGRPQSARPGSFRPVTPNLGQPHTGRMAYTRPEEDEARKRGPSRVKGFLFILFALVVVSLVYSLVSAFQDGGRKELAPEPMGPETAVAVAQPSEIVEQAPYSEFELNGWRVTVESVWEPDLPDAAVIPDGRCVAVDLWIEGGGRLPEARFITPYLQLEDGAQAEAVDNDPLLSRQLKSAGVFDIVPADAQWEDPLYGQLVFFVPEGTAGQVELMIPSAGLEEDPVIFFAIPLDLPWQGAGPAPEEVEPA